MLTLALLAALAAPVLSQDCNIAPFSIPLRNCTFSSGVISWGNLVEVGSPPQRLCLVPSTVINSTLVSQQSLCVKSNTLEPNKCEALRGGFFNENSSTTWNTVSLSAYNSTRSNPTWDHFNPPGFTKVGYDTINMPNSGVKLYGAGIALNQYGNNSNAGMIGLGKDSVFLNDAVLQKRAGSKSWSLDSGSQSLVKPRAGELVIGGYNKGRTDGSFSWQNISDMSGDRPCPLRTKITDMSITLSNGQIVPIKSSAEVVEACIEPYDNLFRFTPGMLLNWKQITSFNETLLAVYSNEAANNLSFTELGLPYASNLVGDWSLTVKLDSGYSSTLPSYELQRPLIGFDNLGNKQAVPGVTNLQILNVPTGQGEVPTLGKIFLSRSYLAVDYPGNQFGLAQAAVDPDPNSNNYVSLACGNNRNGNNSGGSSSKKGAPIGAIVGGVVGGVALILAAIALFWWLRHKKQAQKDNVERQRQASMAPSHQMTEHYVQDQYLPKYDPRQGQHGSVLMSPVSYHGESPSSPYNQPHAQPQQRYQDRSPSHGGVYEVAG